MENWTGIAVTVINGLALFILLDIRGKQREERDDRQLLRKELKEDTKEMWHRIYNHSHVVKCSSVDCKDVETSRVIVPQEPL